MPNENDKQPQYVEDNDDINSEYEMVSDVFDYNALRKEENFVIKMYKNAIYKG